MAKIKSYGYTDTATTATTLSRGALNFGADFRIKTDKAGEQTLVNITSPFDRTETILQSVQPIANVYARTSIDPSVYAPSKQGVKLYTRINDIYKITDDTDASFEQHLPLACSIAIDSINSEFITADDVLRVVARAVSTLFDTGSDTTVRLNALLRGSLKPSDL